jgi:hypothetical protein
MALQLVFEDAAGVVHSQAYARVKRLIIENLASGRQSISMDVEIYDSENARSNGKSPFWGPQGYTFLLGRPPTTEPVPPDVHYLDKPLNQIVMADAYNCLKTLDQFKDSTNV